MEAIVKNLFRRVTADKLGSERAYVSMRERLHSELSDSESEVRQLFARVARSEAKNFFALHLGTELEKFERELSARAERALTNLGSAAPTLDSCLCGPAASSPDGAHPECPQHGDPYVLKQLKENGK